MSECKKTCGNCAGRIESLIYKDRCDITQEVIEDMSATCDDWEADRETRINSLETNLVAAVSQLAKVNEERDALQAQVAVLRGALLNNRIKFCEKFDNRKNHSTICYPPWGNICEELENCEEIERILSTTPSDAAERVQKLVITLEKIRDAKCISDRPGTYYKILADEALSEWRRDKCSS